ncbi:MAG: HAMP domain-containing sensor histidine kinase [Kiloniellales bacterium]|nr:HAMP domain-containing sensor histidine kinase [Kiloniellales bacterium]
MGLKDRKEHQNAESFPFDADVSDLVRKLSSRSVSSASSYVAFENRLALAVAHSINPWGDSPQEGKEPFLVLLSELDADFFNEDALALGIGEVSASLEPVAGRPAIELFGLDRFVAGYVTWHPNSPGDVLLWPLSPAFALGLIAIGYFLFLFVRGADLFVERQAYLASALQQEQNLRDMKMRFVSMISHELRTPLATIRSATELLERYGNRMSSKDQAEELHAIHRSVDVLVRLVDNVVLVGKSDWLGKPGKTVPIDLVEFCYEVWNDLGPVTSSHHLLISEEGERRSLRLDSAYLRALMSNILQNAVKYSPGRDEIMVQLSYKTKTVAIRVTDWGIGISQEDIEEVFEPFKRGRNAESISGSGLGLTIAKASAEAMGGTLAVSSRLGGGTTFEVTFPFSRKEIKV